GQQRPGGGAAFEPLELALAQGHERQLGAGERGVEQDEGADEGELWKGATHSAGPLGGNGTERPAEGAGGSLLASTIRCTSVSLHPSPPLAIEAFAGPCAPAAPDGPAPGV